MLRIELGLPQIILAKVKIVYFRCVVIPTVARAQRHKIKAYFF
jgi:hypothetical protein